MGGDGKGIEEAEGVSWVEGEDEEVGALQSLADDEREELVRMARTGPGMSVTRGGSWVSQFGRVYS